tara:strand:- start:386 stop:1003 length:618 start_codon:yes stop_codon:yes gene_type:complete
MWIDKKFKIVEKIIKNEASKNMTLLDLGARDQFLKKFISNDIKYTGVDRFQNDNDNLIIDLDNDFHKIKEKYDVITALDVIEHLDDPLKFYKNCREYSKKLLLINFPNQAYYEVRLNFLFRGKLTNKFHFSGKPNDDRHRWFTNFNNINKFIKNNKDPNSKFKIINVYKTRNKLFFLYFIEKILGKIFPQFFCWSFLLVEKKINN